MQAAGGADRTQAMRGVPGALIDVDSITRRYVEVSHPNQFVFLCL